METNPTWRLTDLSDRPRYCIRVPDGARVAFADLRKGDRAIMFEPDGAVCDDGEAFQIVEDPIFLSPVGRWVLVTEVATK